MEKVIKNCFNTLLISFFLLLTFVTYPINIEAQPNCVCADPHCLRSCDDIASIGHTTSCKYYVAPTTTPNSYNSSSGMNTADQIIQSGLNDLLIDIQNRQKEKEKEKQALEAQKREKERISAENERISAENERIAAENERIAAENERIAIAKQAEQQRKQKAKDDYQKLQTEQEIKNQMETNAKIRQGEELLLQMESFGNDDKVVQFSVGDPALDIKPLSQTTYQTKEYTDLDRLLCSAYFSDLAKKSTNAEDAKFYADQAERAMFAQTTSIECRIPKVSDEKMAKKMEEVQILYKEMTIKFNDFQDIETKLQETHDTLKKAELKKEEAAKKVKELENRAVTVKPEEKPQVNALMDQALKELQDAEQEVNQSKQSESEYLNKKNQTENELNKLKTQINSKMQPEDK